MDSGKLWILVGKKLSGEATSLELHQLEQFLDAGFSEIYPVEEIERYWHQNPLTPPKDIQAYLDKKWDRFERKLDELAEVDEQESNDTAPYRSFRPYYWMGAAAVAILAVLYSLLHVTPTPYTAAHINEVFAPDRGISKIKLPDGTRVWLNSGSKLSYTKEFGDKLREVKLEGEAYFDVVKDPEHPFIVKTHTINLKVLGTAFNVRSYSNEELTETSLVHGSIQVNLVNSSEKEIILKPSEKLIVSNKVAAPQPGSKSTKVNEAPLITLRYTHKSVKDTLPSEALWLENKLAFDSEPFMQVAKRLERWYNVEIQIKKEELLEKEFTGRFENESLSEALSALRLSYNFDYRITGNRVIIF
ncbi:FecR family protein [Pedobacter sp. SYSU D00535]|uniref:FecR family protein n=1 Tax=Pedobacter sp. SYSU D00535 TaxID=2810308 RepID=UPI001A957B27|nr:FecR family protein [Pedobacter sp. SYSU D00535]